MINKIEINKIGRRTLYMNSITLPLKEPLVATYPGLSFLSAIIKNIPLGYDWLISNFIQVRGYSGNTYYWNLLPNTTPDLKDNYINAWDLCPFIRKFTISSNKMLSNYNSFTDFLISSLSNNLYVCGYLDQYFLPRIKEPGFLHKNLIYGFDLEYKKIYLADHFTDGKYSTLSIDFDTINKSYMLANEAWIQNNLDQVYDNIFLFQLIECNYKFNIKLVTNLLKEYITSSNNYNSIYQLVNGFIDDKGKYFYGIDNYLLLQEYLEKLSSENNNIHKDHRMFTMLRDHKNYLKLLVDYLTSHNYIEQNETIKGSFDNLVMKANIILNLFLKYIVCSSNKFLYTIRYKLNDIKNQEIVALSKLIEMIDANNAS